MGGLPEPKPASLVGPDTSIRLVGPAPRFVSRGGEKLDHALGEFGLDVDGSRAFDAGASTGGFTDCLLQRGAAEVVAFDVGYGQLHDRIRRDPRVRVVERANLRHVDPDEVGAPFDIIVADLSFISLAVVAPALASLGGPETSYVLLVKPQFELGREHVPRGGVVSEPDLHALALDLAATGLAAAGLGVVAATRSPITGSKGNREFIVLARPGSRTLTAADLEAVVMSR